MSNRNPAADPFTPGSGYPPPFLAGREQERSAIEDTMVPRLLAERTARPVLFTGIRGVGKTALLTMTRRLAAEQRLPVVRLEATRRRTLLDDIAYQLDETLTAISSRRVSVRRAVKELDEFKVGMQVAGTGLELGGKRHEPVPTSLDSRFQRLFGAVATAAADNSTPLLVVVDELQQGPADLLGPLLTAVHLANQDEIPIGLVAAGLPHTEDWVTEQVTYGGRMFDHHPIGLLDETESADAYTNTLAVIPGESFTTDALERLVQHGQGVPYLIHEYGSATWRNAQDDPISRADVDRATPHAASAISSFYAQRLAEASRREAEYLAAAARLGDGPLRSADIAAELGRPPSEVASFRARLIANKGLLTEPTAGVVEFALPGMAEWLRTTDPSA